MISTEVKNWVIVQHSGAVEFLTEKQADLVINGQASGARGFKNFDTGEWMSFGSISDIMSVQKYYEKYPDKVPVQAKEFVADEVIPMTSAQITSMRRGLLKGLKSYIDEQTVAGKVPSKAVKIYQDRLEKIQHSNQVANLV